MSGPAASGSQPAAETAGAEVPAPGPAAGGSDRISRNASWAFATQMTGAVLTAGLTLFLGRQLSQHAYGSFAFALSVGSVVALLADMGIGAAASRFLAERRHDATATRSVFALALRAKLGVASVASATLFLLAGPISDVFGSPDAVWAVRGIAVALLGESLLLLVLAAFTSVGRISFNWRIAATESVTEVAASIALVLAGAGATGAAFGRAIGYGVGAAIALFLAARVLGGLRSPRGFASDVSARRLIGYAAPLLIVDGLSRAFSSVDVLLISALLGGGANVAIFELPMKLAWFLHYPVGGISAAIAPRMTLEGEHPPDVASFNAGVRYTVLMQALLVAPVVVWAEPIMTTLFGSKYQESAQVLRALAPFIYLAGPAMLISVAVIYLGEARRRIPILLVGLVANVVIDVLLLKPLGPVAGAIGTDVAYAIWVPVNYSIARRVVDLPVRPVLVSASRGLLAGGATAGVLAALGTTSLSLSDWVLGAVLGPLAFVAVLVVTRELTRADVDILRRILRRGKPGPAEAGSHGGPA